MIHTDKKTTRKLTHIYLHDCIYIGTCRNTYCVYIPLRTFGEYCKGECNRNNKCGDFKCIWWTEELTLEYIRILYIYKIVENERHINKLRASLASNLRQQFRLGPLVSACCTPDIFFFFFSLCLWWWLFFSPSSARSPYSSTALTSLGPYSQKNKIKKYSALLQPHYTFIFF